jgi:hypothetical protein
MQTRLLVCLVAPFLLYGAADVYRWTDADGVVHYSDRPTAGAEKVTVLLPPASAAAGPSTATPPVVAGQEPRNRPPRNYKSLTIERPTKDQVLWNIAGQLEVAARADPELDPGHRLQILLDGQPVALLPAGALQTQLSGVFRGAHTVQAEIQDDEGRTLELSDGVPFMVQQTTILKPAATPPPPPRRP